MNLSSRASALMAAAVSNQNWRRAPFREIFVEAVFLSFATHSPETGHSLCRLTACLARRNRHRRAKTVRTTTQIKGLPKNAKMRVAFNYAPDRLRETISWRMRSRPITLNRNAGPKLCAT
jgi:hypothetical protein